MSTDEPTASSSSSSVTPQSSSSSLGTTPTPPARYRKPTDPPPQQRSWARRVSLSSRNKLPALPGLPQLPNLPQLPPNTPGLATLQNLRAALLGYLGEVEDSVRSLKNVSVSDAGTLDSDFAGSSSGWDEAEEEETAWSSSVAPSSARLRAGKGKGAVTSAYSSSMPPAHASAGADAGTTAAGSRTSHIQAADNRTNHEALLAHLSNLRADVQAYLPLPPMPSFRVPSMPMPLHTPGTAAASASAAVAQTQEWLRNLPGRLRAVERALPGISGGGSASGAGAAVQGRSMGFGELMSSFPFPSYAYGADSQSSADNHHPGGGEGEGATLGGSRRRLLEMVRSVLPSDEWEGWERLGWEETELNPDDRQDWPGGRSNPWKGGSGGTRLTRSLSHPARMQYPPSFEDEDDEAEEDEEDRGEGDEDTDDLQDVTGDETTADEAETADDNDGAFQRRGTARRNRTRATSNFLFPNRTPAATEAIKRRRNVRSRSLGSAGHGHAGRWAGLLDNEFTQSTSQRPSVYSTSAAEEDTAAADGLDAEGNAMLDPVVGGVADPHSHSQSPTKLKARAPTLNRNKSSVRIGYANEFGPSVAEALERSEDGQVLVTYDDLPVDWRNNEHVLTGYRFIPLHASTGPIPLIKSAFAWHNETLNIHTHFIPTVLVLCFIPFLLYSSPLPDAHPLDTIVLALYLVAAVSCMFSSAMWHVLSGCASKKWFEWGACVDYIGISWLIAASFGTVVYNAFYCRPKLVYLYLGTNAACGALGSYLPFQRWFNMRKMKPWRIAFFLFLNFAMFAPLLQLFWTHGWAAARFCAAFVPSICAYVAGLLFYGFHFPECVWPGRFDTWSASHQIWHTAIVLAIVLHYRAVFSAHGMRHDLTCAVPGAGVEVGRAVETWVKGLWA